jgi:GTPase
MDTFDDLVRTLEEKKQLPEESEDNNIEYKLRLDCKNKSDILKLTTQLNWRVAYGYDMTGSYTAYYVIGINDNGTIGKITEDELTSSCKILREIVQKNDLSIIKSKILIFDGIYVGIYKISKILEKPINELNVLIIGASGSGKTTTLSRLVYGHIDDGNGSARKHILRHEHERDSGKTSSIKREIIGFAGDNMMNHAVGLESSWELIVKNSDRIINLIDLPGDVSYRRTLLYAISSMIGNIDGIIFCQSIDDKGKTDKVFYDDLIINTYCTNILKIMTKIDLDLSTSRKKIVGISNITGDGFETVIDYLRKLRKQEISKPKIDNVIFSVLEVFTIPESGNVYFGIVKSGQLKLNQQVEITDGEISKSGTITSIKRKQIDSDIIYEGESGSIKLNIDFVADKNIVISTNKLEITKQIIFRPNEMEMKKIKHIKKNYSLFVNNMIFNCSLTNISIDYDKTDKYFTVQYIHFELNKPLIILPYKQTGIIFCDEFTFFGNIEHSNTNVFF